MVITHFGSSCLKIQSGDTTLVIDPFSKGGPRFEAALALFTNPEGSHEHNLGGSPLTVTTPGEYEAGGISCVGFEGQKTTPFYIEWEGMRLLHLGSASDEETLQYVSDHAELVDILFFSPHGSPKEAQKAVSNIDPRIVIAIGDDQAKKNLDTFVKEMGEKPEKMNKLTIKKKGLPTEGQRLIVLETDRS